MNAFGDAGKGVCGNGGGIPGEWVLGSHAIDAATWG